MHICAHIYRYISIVSILKCIFLEFRFQIPPPKNVCCVLFQNLQMSLKQIRSIVWITAFPQALTQTIPLPRLPQGPPTRTLKWAPCRQRLKKQWITLCGETGVIVFLNAVPAYLSSYVVRCIQNDHMLLRHLIKKTRCFYPSFAEMF